MSIKEARMGEMPKNFVKELAFTPEVARATREAYAKVAHVIPEVEWAVHAPYVAEINRLKKEKNAVILAHNYMTPEIFYCVSDFRGDSLQLAREAAKTDAQVIIQAGVHFMAETSKILSPEKTVLIPDTRAGCSLAASITGADIRLLKQKYPGLPVVSYVNTSADVKAESDVCCTSSNAVAVVEDIAREKGVDTVIMTPDEYLAQNVAKQTAIKIITWKGHCEVHERFTAEEIRHYRAANPGVVVLAHPECPPDVVAEADFSGSTSAMIGYVGNHRPKRVVMVTECSMSDNVAQQYPDVEFVRPCNLCPHMKRITLPQILHALETMTYEVLVDPVIAERAKAAVERMLAVKIPAAAAAKAA
ncbi:MAG: quinolinate synthase NadA [Alphaproteobacteria bacterium]|nr:quinolinate synthase NadA [Alphaproteobacteria bacterium]OJU56557.1 MAG: quinolinate synthase [Alphaproteobacteria bacterium 62-8]